MAPTRRSVLRSLVFAGATTTLAGCGGGGDDETAPTTTPPPQTTEAMETTTTVQEATTEQATTTTAEQTATPEATTTDAPTETEDGSTVDMVGSTFSPVRLEVPTDTTVVWENEDSFGHTVVADQFHDVAESWSFESETLGGNDSTRYTFDSSGVYEYYCDIHGRTQMCGAILVGGATLDQELPCE